jgi:hypothetical protein
MHWQGTTTQFASLIARTLCERKYNDSHKISHLQIDGFSPATAGTSVLLKLGEFGRCGDTCQEPLKPPTVVKLIRRR